jgi:hypothetical protein
VADGDDGMKAGSCPNRKESPPLDDKSRSLVLVNYFRSISMKKLSCEDNSENLMNMLRTCDGAAASRWANFVAVNYYKVYLSHANYLIISSSINIRNRIQELRRNIIFYFLGAWGCRGVKEEDHFKLWTC